MAIAVVGSIGFDSISTPFDAAEREPGGSALYAALAASFFTDVHVIGPVGADFEPEHEELFSAREIATSGIERLPGDTFHWRGRYEFDMSVAHTEETRLNVFDGWRPSLAAEESAADILFCAAMDPEAQADVRAQWQGSRWSALDTIPYWIENKREALIEAIGGVDIVLMNDQEARQLTGELMLLHAAGEIMSWGPRAVVIKHGEYGCSLLTPEGYFWLLGYPLELAADPTGTGDAFAGGLLGYLDRAFGDKLTEGVLKRALTYGSVMASFCAEELGVRRLVRLREDEVDYRYDEFKSMTHFEQLSRRERLRDSDSEPKRGFKMPGSTAGTRGYEEPRHTGGTPSFGAPGPSRGTPSYDAPTPTPGTPSYRPRRGR